LSVIDVFLCVALFTKRVFKTSFRYMIEPYDLASS